MKIDQLIRSAINLTGLRVGAENDLAGILENYPQCHCGGKSRLRSVINGLLLSGEG